MKIVRQETDFDCAAAVLAMLLGCSLQEAKARFPVGIDFTQSQTTIVHIEDIMMILAGSGFTIAPFWNRLCSSYVSVPFIKGPGFAQIEWNSAAFHLVAISEDNDVFDPLKDEPAKLTDYERINFVAAVRRQRRTNELLTSASCGRPSRKERRQKCG